MIFVTWKQRKLICLSRDKTRTFYRALHPFMLHFSCGKKTRSVLEKKEKIVLSWSCVTHMFCLKWNKSENKLYSWYYCDKNVVRYAGDRPKGLGALRDRLRIYTQEFLHNSENRKWPFHFRKRMKIACQTTEMSWNPKGLHYHY